MPPPQGEDAEWTAIAPVSGLPAHAGKEVIMRRLVPLLSLSAAVALLLVGGLIAPRFSAAPAAAKETITVIEHATTDTMIDLGDKGDSIGDTLAFGNDVYDATDANVVGSDQGSCVRTKPGKAWECSFTTMLSDGSILAQGPFYDTEDSVLAITGGTGKYSGASGEMELKARDNGTKFEFVFNIN
jgi:hypothetical protein